MRSAQQCSGGVKVEIRNILSARPWTLGLVLGWAGLGWDVNGSISDNRGDDLTKPPPHTDWDQAADLVFQRKSRHWDTMVKTKPEIIQNLEIEAPDS